MLLSTYQNNKKPQQNVYFNYFKMKSRKFTIEGKHIIFIQFSYIFKKYFDIKETYISY